MPFESAKAILQEMKTKSETKKRPEYLDLVDKIDTVLSERLGIMKDDKTGLSSALRLHMYNVFSENHDRETVDREVAKMEKLVSDEDKYKNPLNPLPTVGIELEVPDKFLDKQKVKILDLLRVPNYMEINRQSGYQLWEINPNFSYNPSVQSRILQELASMEFVPLTERENGTYVVDKNFPLSLHINFGVPFAVEEQTDRLNLNIESKKFADIMTYAFTSPERMKTKKNDEIVTVRTGNVLPSIKNKKEGDNLKRLEFQAAEFGDYPTFRLLKESQAIASALFSYVKSINGLKLSSQEEQLKNIWKNFVDDASATMGKRGLEFGEFSLFKDKAIDALRDVEFVKQMRDVITRYSKSILKGIFPENFKDKEE